MASPAPRYASNEGVIDALSAVVGSALIEAVESVGEIKLVVQRDRIVEVMTALRDQGGYQQLMEIAGVDWPDRAERFEVVYCLLSLTKNHRIRVHLSANEDQPVPSITGIWPVAGWLEREVYDMYGVLFDGNPDLRRILTDYGFRGHPQRKDFPLTGYVELRYSEEAKRVVYEPVQLAQDFRSFDFMSPWEGAQYVLPGDEKAAVPEAKGAPTPLKADEIRKADAVKAVSPPPTPMTTEKKSDTGAGEPANAEAAKKTRKGKQAEVEAKPAAARAKAPARAPRTKKTAPSRSGPGSGGTAS